MITSLVKETSNIDFDGSTNPDTEWKDTLQQQLTTKIKMDADSGNDTDKEARKYVPVISGEPGIGKCLRSNQRVIVDVDKTLFEKIMSNRTKKL